MPRCYLLCLCERSVLDAVTNNFTLVSVVEELQLPKPPPLQDFIELPLEMHVYWILSVEEMGRPFEFRLIAKAKDFPDMASQPMQVKETLSRRFVQGLLMHRYQCKQRASSFIFNGIG